MDQQVTYQRSDKVADARVGSGGGSIESFKTRIIRTIHYETRVISTNYGPLGVSDKVEIDDSRKALTERSWAAIVHPNTMASQAEDAKFKHDMTTTELRVRINQLRVVSCLCAYVLVFIKELPFCRPNLRYAMRLTDEWDRIFREEYDIPTCTDRKKIKLRMLFELFAVEGAVVEKFFSCMESSVEFPDMRPNEDGTLDEWDVTQLADVVRNLQRHLDPENILNAWSHNMDHTPSTTAMAFHLKTVLAQMHGDAIDLRRLRTGGDASVSVPEPPAAPQAETAVKCADIERGCADAMEVDATPPPARGRLPVGANAGDPPVQPAAETGGPTPGGFRFKQIMAEGLTRSDCSVLGQQLSARRQLRNKMSCALADSGSAAGRARPGETETTRIGRVVAANPALRQVHLPNGSGPVELSAAQVAGSHLPTLDEVLNSGVPQELLNHALVGMSHSVKTLGLDHGLAMLGMSATTKWEYRKLKHNSHYPGPADWDFYYARVKPPKSLNASSAPPAEMPDAVGPGASPAPDGGGPRGGGGGGGGGAVGAVGGGRCWARRAALKIMSESNNGEMFSMPKEKNVTEAIYRDMVLQLADANDRSNMHNVPQRREEDYKRVKSLHSDFTPIDCQPHGKPSDANTINPDCIFERRLVKPSFSMPARSSRIECGLPHEDNLYQRRLDHLNDNCALPTCVRPQQFTRAAPIMEDKEPGGSLYFNKWVSAGHAAWVVEISAMLANVAGLSGSDLHVAPDSLKVQAFRGVESEDAAEEQPESGLGRGPVPPSEAARRAADETAVPRELARAVSAPGSSGGGSSSLGPTSEDERAKAEAMPLRQDTKVTTMYYEWDMQATALTIIANDMLHYDCEDNFDAAIDNYPDVFEVPAAGPQAAGRNQLRQRMMRDRPQHSLRFSARPGTAAHILVPLTRAVPLRASRHIKACKPTANCELSLSETYKLLQQESLAEGRPLSFSSVQYMNAESKLKNTDDLEELTGNLFARSTWVHFTNKQLDKRGHLTDAEQDRLVDHGVYIRLQVRNARAANPTPDCPGAEYSKHIGKVPKARLTSMEAQERMTIEYADDPRKGGGEYGELHRERCRLLREQQSRNDGRLKGAALACKRRRERGLVPGSKQARI